MIESITSIRCLSTFMTSICGICEPLLSRLRNGEEATAGELFEELNVKEISQPLAVHTLGKFKFTFASDENEMEHVYLFPILPPENIKKINALLKAEK